MAASVDIAGAIAPAASRSGMPDDARTDGATRSAHAAGKTKSRGARASGSAKAGTDQADTGNAFDTQLDAALPDAEGQGVAKSKATATSGAPQPAPDKDEARDQAPNGGVLTPWMFAQRPVDVIPVGNGDDVAASSAGETPSGAKVQDAATGATDESGKGRDLQSGPGTPAGIQTSLTQAAVADSVAGPSATATCTETGLADVPAPKAAAVSGVSSDKASPVAQSSTAGESTTPLQGAVRDLKLEAPDVSAASNPNTTKVTEAAGATPTRLTQPVSTSGAEPSASTNGTTVQDSSVESPRPADAPAASTAINAATPEQGAVDLQAASVAASAATPAAGPRADATRGDASLAKGRSAAVHGLQRHGFQPAASRESVKGQRGPAVDAPTNVAAVDDQRRNGSSPETDVQAAKTPVFAVGSDVPAHEAPPVASAVRVTHAIASAMPSLDGTRQVPVDAAPLAESSAAPAADVPDPDTPHRLVQSLRMQFLRGGGDAIVQLRPEHLGQVTVSLRVEQGSVAARITAADPVVAEWLQAHQDSLREGLQANGLTLDRLSIDRDGRSPDRRERREPPQRQRFRPANEPQSTFELTI